MTIEEVRATALSQALALLELNETKMSHFGVVALASFFEKYIQGEISASFFDEDSPPPEKKTEAKTEDNVVRVDFGKKT